MTPFCPGTISTGLAGEALCSVAWETPETAWDAVDPAEFGSYFAAGFVFVVVAWAVGKSVAVILDLIRR